MTRCRLARPGAGEPRPEGALETAQLGVSLLIGAAYRSVDINDVLLNAAGVLLGYALFRGCAWGYARLRTIKV